MSGEGPKLQFIIIHESVAQSWIRDASTFALFAGLIGVGVVLESSAMQWAGFIVAAVFILGRARSQKIKRMSREEAIRFLEEGR